MVVFLPIILNLDPYTSDYTAFSAAPSGAHILGTDAIGRDVFARLMYGGRTSLLVGFVSTLISCAIGVPLGLVAGYARGKAEAIIMRIADIFMSFPSIVLILVLVAVLGPSVWSVNLCHWCARLDTVCQTDLCKCTFRIRERICRICKGNWYLQFQDRRQSMFFQTLLPRS